MATISTHSNQQGKIRKAIRVQTDDPGARILMLTVTANLQPPIEVQPRFPISVTVREGERTEKRLLLHRHDGKPLEVTSVTSRNPNLVMARATVVTHKEKIDDLKAVPGDVWLDLTVPGRRGTSFATTQISVASNTPHLPLLMIPVYVRIRQLVDVVPPRARVVLPPKGGVSLVRLVRLRQAAGKKFKILSATSDHPDLFSAEIDNSKAVADHTVRIHVSSQAAQKRIDHAIRGKVELRTDLPERPTIAIPVEITRTQPARRPTPGVVRGVRGSRVPTPVGGTRLKGGPPGTATPVGPPVPATGPTTKAPDSHGTVGG